MSTLALEPSLIQNIHYFCRTEYDFYRKMSPKQSAMRFNKLVIIYIFTILFSLFTIHCFAACYSPVLVSAKIGSPANGANHCIDISWSPAVNAVSYKLSYSTDNISWYDLYTGACFSYHHILADVPNSPFYYRVSGSSDGIVFCTPTNCSQFPIYTACDASVLKVSNPLSHTLQLTFLQETPVSNPAITLYSIFCKTNSLYVQANGTLKSTEVYQTKAQWAKVIVSGLSALTQYCFYAKAKNINGDVRYNLNNKILSPTQTFDTPSSVSTFICTPTYVDHSKWNLCPTCSPPWFYSDTVGCLGGGIAYKSKGSCFVYSPYFDITGMQFILVSFNISNSFNASYSQNSLQMFLYNDSSSNNPNINLYLDRYRKCEYDEFLFTVNSFYFYKNLARTEVLITSNPASNSPDYTVKLDNITVIGQTINLVCGTTRQECTAPKISINQNSQAKCIGDNIIFTTKSSGTDTLFYQWRKNNINILGATTNNYQLTTINENDAGTYTCIASNFCGSATSSNVVLTVSSPMTIKLTPDNSVRCTGDSMTFKLNLTGNPLSYIWKKGSNIISNATSSSFYIAKIAGSDEDFYTCIVTNACGADSSTTLLNVNYPASINVSSLTITKSVGDSLKFSLSPYGTPPFFYKWFRNDTLISGFYKDSLIVKPIIKADEGVYTCEITNICGTTTSKISTLIVNNGNLYSLSGKVIYDNKSSTPLKNTSLYLLLKSDSLNVKDSVNLDSLGNYVFNNIVAGEYILKIKTSLPWGGVNPVDALLINRYFIRMATLSDALTILAADVNNDNKINPVDALLTNRRYLKLIKNFTKSDWLFDNQPVIITNNTNLNIKAICTGDVNASY